MKEFNIEERVEKARRLFKEGGYNCCQAVVLAYNDLFDLDDETAAAISSGFGGGMGRMREVCGSVSGMTLLAGLMKPASDPSVKDWRTANYALVQKWPVSSGLSMVLSSARSSSDLSLWEATPLPRRNHRNRLTALRSTTRNVLARNS